MVSVRCYAACCFVSAVCCSFTRPYDVVAQMRTREITVSEMRYVGAYIAGQQWRASTSHKSMPQAKRRGRAAAGEKAALHRRQCCVMRGRATRARPRRDDKVSRSRRASRCYNRLAVTRAVTAAF